MQTIKHFGHPQKPRASGQCRQPPVLTSQPNHSAVAARGIRHCPLASAGLARGAFLNAQPVQDALAQRLAKYKFPKRVIFVEDPPRNAMGNVQKNLLCETFKDLFVSRAGICS
jgi:acyl-CoA synthetase (AMP-forming)/AMP-acid ligase II